MLKSPPKDLQVQKERLVGFYRGVVEDNVDPLKAGRVRVRIHGLHTPLKVKNELEGIPVDELPWAEPCMPIHEGSVSGFGTWAVPLQGSHVMLFFENGNPTQPRYFASMPAIPSSKDSYDNDKRDTTKNDGFRDPNGEYPTNYRLEEPDFHRLARGKKAGTLVDTKNNERDIAVVTALGGSWSEPESPYAARYPHNHVIATHGGITIELDSTPGSTRLHIYHPSNSFIEIDSDGNMVVKNQGEKYEIVTEGKNIHIKQQRNITIDEDSKKKIEGDETIEVGGTKQIQIDESKIEAVDVNLDQTIGGNKTEEITGNKSETIGGNKTEEITGNKSETIGGNKTEDISGGLGVSVAGASTIESDGLITITGNANIVIESGNVEITGGTIQAGSHSTLYRLVNELMITKYNNHIHKNAGGADEPRDAYKLVAGIETTTNLEAS